MRVICTLLPEVIHWTISPLSFLPNKYQKSISGYKISWRHRKQRYRKNWICYSDHFKTWLCRDHPLIFTLAMSASRCKVVPDV